MRTLAYPFQFLIIADLIGPFPLGQLFTYWGKYLKPIIPEKKPINGFRVQFPQG
jgi:hypothetical protein